MEEPGLVCIFNEFFRSFSNATTVKKYMHQVYHAVAAIVVGIRGYSCYHYFYYCCVCVGKGVHNIRNMVFKITLHQYVWASVTIYHNWWLINNRSLFLTVLEVEKSKIKVLADLGSGESLLPVSFFFFTLTAHGRGGKGTLGAFLNKSIIPFMRAPPWRPYLLITITLGVQILTYGCRG